MAKMTDIAPQGELPSIAPSSTHDEIRREKHASWRAWCASFARVAPWQLLRVVKPKMKNTVEDLEVGGRLD